MFVFLVGGLLVGGECWGIFFSGWGVFGEFYVCACVWFLDVCEFHCMGIQYCVYTYNDNK